MEEIALVALPRDVDSDAESESGSSKGSDVVNLYTRDPYLVSLDPHKSDGQASAGPQEPLRRTKTIISDDWEKYKDVIHQLYIEGDMPLQKVIQTLSADYGFEAT
jgi:hypothetical protein